MSKSGGSQEVLALRGRDLLSQPRKRVVRCDGRGDAGRSMLESPCHVRPLERPSRKFRRVSANAHRAAPFRAAMAETAALQQDSNFCSKNGFSIPSACGTGSTWGAAVSRGGTIPAFPCQIRGLPVISDSQQTKKGHYALKSKVMCPNMLKPSLVALGALPI